MLHTLCFELLGLNFVWSLKGYYLRSSQSLVQIRPPRLQQCCEIPQKGRRVGAEGAHATAYNFLNIHFYAELRMSLEPSKSQDSVELRI